MKKYLVALVWISLLFSQKISAEDSSTQIYASDIEIKDPEQYGFVGITGGYLNLEQSLEAEAVYFPRTESKGVAGIRAGIQTNVWRTMFTVESNFESYQAFLIEADRTVVAGLIEGKGRIYLGVSGGWIKFYGDRTTIYDNVLVDFEDYGYAYGGNFGFMYYLSDQVDLSLEYRYLLTSSSCSLDDIQGVNVALHYFF